jgi:hypothetical protein
MMTSYSMMTSHVVITSHFAMLCDNVTSSTAKFGNDVTYRHVNSCGDDVVVNYDVTIIYDITIYTDITSVDGIILKNDGTLNVNVK